MKSYLDNFRLYYAKARTCVQERNPKLAREYVKEMLEIYKNLYLRSNEIEKKNFTIYIKQWVKVSEDLRTIGISDYVLSMFGLAMEAYTNDSEWKTTIFKRHIHSVVKIKCIKKNLIINGTGFFISKDGYFLTNDHVVFDEGEMDYYQKRFISLYENENTISFNVIASDKKNDIALCKAMISTEVTAIPICKNLNSIEVGNEVLLIGNPFGMNLCPSEGIIRYTLSKENNDSLVSTIPSNPGDSGGPILNKKGECIAINKSILSSVIHCGHREEANRMTNATRADVILIFIEKWKKEYQLELKL